MGLIVPGDVLDAGMGNDADFAPGFLLAADDVPDAGEGGGDVIDDVFLPAVVFVHDLLLGEVVPLPAHVGKAQTEAALGVLVEGDFRPRAELIENVAEEGVIDGGLALHDGIVVVEDKTGVFQHSDSPNIFSFPIIPDPGRRRNQKIPLAYIEQMCYNGKNKRRWARW